jgi:hypothetical protein
MKKQIYPVPKVRQIFADGTIIEDDRPIVLPKDIAIKIWEGILRIMAKSNPKLYGYVLYLLERGQFTQELEDEIWRSFWASFVDYNKK